MRKPIIGKNGKATTVHVNADAAPKKKNAVSGFFSRIARLGAPPAPIYQTNINEDLAREIVGMVTRTGSSFLTTKRARELFVTQINNLDAFHVDNEEYPHERILRVPNTNGSADLCFYLHDSFRVGEGIVAPVVYDAGIEPIGDILPSLKEGASGQRP